MADIQLLLKDDANRQALASVVAEEYTATTDLKLQPADLYLVDDASLPEYQADLEVHKQEQDPVFCPVVLVQRDRTPTTIDLPDAGSRERPLLVNEVVKAPVGKQTLFSRIANLLARRRQTTELQETKERQKMFAKMLRHELRNPLNILDGYLEIARDQRDPEAFERCETAVDQMERMLKDTLTIVRGDNLDLTKEPVDLAALARRCQDQVAESEAEIEIETRQKISADRDRLTQLLENLFRNAIEHGRPDVTIMLGGLEDGFYVEDDGPGIPEDERETVFKEGYTTNEAGSGLGLGVVQRVADIHGWNARVTEGVAGGARFEIRGIESFGVV